MTGKHFPLVSLRLQMFSVKRFRNLWYEHRIFFTSRLKAPFRSTFSFFLPLSFSTATTIFIYWCKSSTILDFWFIRIEFGSINGDLSAVPGESFYMNSSTFGPWILSYRKWPKFKQIKPLSIGVIYELESFFSTNVDSLSFTLFA